MLAWPTTHNARWPGQACCHGYLRETTDCPEPRQDQDRLDSFGPVQSRAAGSRFGVNTRGRYLQEINAATGQGGTPWQQGATYLATSIPAAGAGVL